MASCCGPHAQTLRPVLPVSSTVSCVMQGRVRDVKWNDDLGRIASLDADGTVRLWDAELELVQEVSFVDRHLSVIMGAPGVSQVLTLPFMPLLVSPPLKHCAVSASMSEI